MGIIEVHLKHGCVYGPSLNYQFPLYDVNANTKDGFLFVSNTMTKRNVLMLPLSELKYVIVREEATDA